MNRKNIRNQKSNYGLPLNKRQLKSIANKKYGIPFIIILVIVVGLITIFGEDEETPQGTTEISNGEIVPGERYEVEVSRYIDGDTAEFYFNGEAERFRFIIIDAPEIDREYNNHDPYAIESLERVEELLDNADTITVEFDTGEIQDNYDRYLAYVYADDVLLNVQLVEEGLASVRYTNTDNRKYIDDMYDAEETAKEKTLGIWSE
ncbi:thermonuclease family protein [Aliicoccus persicus]|uniref:Micrococcal nuclease n=1 Tax=Aliicoccus persicus TaxID=930138 RepID=A0A662Z5D5_9STAP|nr:thermonuclease family protein [Aliicoccus persicus]SEV88324.1 micrococcal nuclease [Aliicoccus persicus]